jgi:23S rRNA pseudouridine2605 synthase
VLIYHKAQGQPVTAGGEDADDASAKSVMESLPSVRGQRWLVINTMQAGDSGLLVLTNDGKLADGLRRRAESMPAAYVARVLVPTEDFDVAALPRVVQYDDDTIEFESIEPAGGEGTNRWFRVNAPRAHRRAAVRALFESRGLKVSRVIQVQFGDLELPRDLPRGRHRALPDQQVARLYERAGLAVPDEESEAAVRPRRPGKRVAPDRRRKPAAHNRGATGSRSSRR